jgi:ubiquinone/menaquinone biosynthesis C-methylase UbiE
MEAMKKPQLSVFEEAESRIREAYDRRKTNPVAGRYLDWFNKGNVFLQQERERKMLDLLQREGMSDLSRRQILEVGCGTGDLLRGFVKWGVPPENVVGVDLLEDSAAQARVSSPPRLRIEVASASNLPFDDEEFDIVLQSTVFTSVLDAPLKQRIGSEMLRVVRGDGLILWYDFTLNNPFNRDVSGVKMREIRTLFPGCRLDLRRVTLAAPLLYTISPVSWTATHLLSQVPFLCSHLIGSIRKAR